MESPNKENNIQYWSKCKVKDLYNLPFMDLIYKAASIHRENFNPNEIQVSSLLSIKTGGCPENCAYCSQSAHHKTGINKESLMPLDEILERAQIAKSRGASRFCLATAWRGPRPRDISYLTNIIQEVKNLGLDTCASFGLLEEGMAESLKDAGLDYYNHNLDTTPENYQAIIQTRNYEDRINTIQHIQHAGLKLCCGGIIGINENEDDRAMFIANLANLEPQPESVPINQLVKIQNTPLENAKELDWTDFVRTIAIARITMPKSHIRLSAGRNMLDEAAQGLCFLAGANSIFFGDKLLTTENNEESFDLKLMQKLNLIPEKPNFPE
ncbi:biotin synthase BioB [Neisseriaceae bacterium PsAf]|nr:biotin synthase BioB [Neisseriaceae bacterium PsAf]